MVFSYYGNMKKLIGVLSLVLIFTMVSFVSAETQSNFKYDTITIRFVDGLTLEPIKNSQIEIAADYEGLSRYGEEDGYVYYNPNSNLFQGSYTLEDVKVAQGTIKKEKLKPLTTDSKGEIKLLVDAKGYKFRSDKADNINYVSQGDSFDINFLNEPEHTIYLKPIFDIKVKLKTNFNFLFSFFRMFRYGSYLEAPASELNMNSVIEPNCFMTTLQKGATIKQYSKTIDIRAYFSRDLNSPNKEPYECSIYAWESVRKVGGIEQIDFASMKQGEINELELPLDMTYDELITKYPSIKPPESN